MLWGDSLYDINNWFDAIFRQGQRDEIIKWVVERKEKGTVKYLFIISNYLIQFILNLTSNTLKVTVSVLVGFLLYRKRTYFLVESPKPDGKPKYQEVLPVNLTVKGWPLVVANWLVTSGFGRLIGFPGNVETMISMGRYRTRKTNFR